MYCLIHAQNMQYHYIPICLSVSCFHLQELKTNVTQEFSKISLNGYTSECLYTHYSWCIIPLRIFEGLFQFLYRMSIWKDKKIPGSPVSTLLHSSLPMHYNSDASQDKTLNLPQRLKIQQKIHNMKTREIFLGSSTFFLPDREQDR